MNRSLCWDGTTVEIATNLNENTILELVYFTDFGSAEKREMLDRFVVKSEKSIHIGEVIISPNHGKVAILGSFGCLTIKRGEQRTLHLLPISPAETAVWYHMDRYGDHLERYLYTSAFERYDFETGKVTKLTRPLFPKGLSVRTTGMMYLPEQGGRIILKVVFDEFEGYGINKTFVYSIRNKRWKLV
ncbi:MAG: hypothetical protein ACYDBB_05260 [Armatimonadota bacterium]